MHFQKNSLKTLHNVLKLDKVLGVNAVTNTNNLSAIKEKISKVSINEIKKKLMATGEKGVEQLGRPYLDARRRSEQASPLNNQIKRNMRTAYTSKNIDVNGAIDISHAEADSGTPSAYSLKATSNITTSAGVYASSTHSSSDDRIKFGEAPVADCMTTLQKLEPMYYEKIMTIPKGVTGNWMPSDAEWPNVKSQYDYGHEYGFVAQSVRDIPELSTLVKGSGFDGNGTQALYTRLMKDKRRRNQLDHELTTLEREVERLRNRKLGRSIAKSH